MNAFDPRLPLIAAQAKVKTCHIFHCWSAIRETGAAFHVGAFATFAGLEERHVTAIMAALDENCLLPKRRATVRAKAATGDDSLAKRVIEAWNAQKGLTASRGMDEALQKHLDARVKAHGEQSVFDAIRRIGASPWHCGKNDGGWKASLSWMLSSAAKFLIALELPDPQDKANIRKTSPLEIAERELSSAILLGRDYEADIARKRIAALSNVLPFAKSG
jgi:hypothetical protein